MNSMKKRGLRAAVAALALGSAGIALDVSTATAQAPGNQWNGNQGAGQQVMGQQVTGQSIPSAWNQLIAPPTSPSATSEIVEWAPPKSAAKPTRLPLSFPFLSGNASTTPKAPAQPQFQAQQVQGQQVQGQQFQAQHVQGQQLAVAAGPEAGKANFSVAGFSAHSTTVGSACEPCQTGHGGHAGSTYSSPYAGAMSSGWDGDTACSSGACGSTAASGILGPARPPLYPWFGSAGLTFWNLENGGSQLIATGLGNDFRTSGVDPGSNVGFDVGFGRYFANGQYGVGVNYMRWDPDQESIFRDTAVIGGVRPAIPSFRGASVDLGSGPLNVYDLIDDYGFNGFAERDLSFQGIEVNLFGFGLMGAQRAAFAGCGPGGCGPAGPLGLGAGLGFGGATGPLARSNSGRLRVTTSQGFRWFQIEDNLHRAFSTNADAAPTGPQYAAYSGTGLPATTISEDTHVDNNLFGYQFGGNLTYCLGRRLNLNIGGKFGVYGNHVEVDHCLYSDEGLAYISGGTAGTDDIHVVASDTVLATLGELDLGLGYRINNAWTARTGYRVLGINGVASSVESVPRAYTTVAELERVDANDSFVLHGAYVGLDFNW